MIPFQTFLVSLGIHISSLIFINLIFIIFSLKYSNFFSTINIITKNITFIPINITPITKETRYGNETRTETYETCGGLRRYPDPDRTQQPHQRRRAPVRRSAHGVDRHRGRRRSPQTLPLQPDHRVRGQPSIQRGRASERHPHSGRQNHLRGPDLHGGPGGQLRGSPGRHAQAGEHRFLRHGRPGCQRSPGDRSRSHCGDRGGKSCLGGWGETE